MKPASMLLIAIGLICGAAAGRAAEELAVSKADTLAAVVVREPRPVLWRVTKGSKGIWILGTVQPLPKEMKGFPSSVMDRIANAQEVLGPEGLTVGDNLGFFRGLTLWPSIRHARFNPDGKRLKDVLPPELYARWSSAKSQYLGSDGGVERLRPMYAAFELFEAALKKRGLTMDNLAAEAVRREAKKHRIAVRDAKLHLEIDSPKTAVKEFSVPVQDDVRCLEQTLDDLDGFLARAVGLADAWAAGDLSSFEEAEREGPRMTFCWSRLTNEAIARQQGVEDLSGRIRAQWLEGIRRSLSEHDLVFATLPVRELLGSSPLLSSLKHEGFEVALDAQDAKAAGAGED